EPTFDCLFRLPVDQIDIERGKFTNTFESGMDFKHRLRSADGAVVCVSEGLDADTDALDAALGEAVKAVSGRGLRRGFHGCGNERRRCGEIELGDVEKSMQLARRKVRRLTAADREANDPPISVRRLRQGICLT